MSAYSQLEVRFAKVYNLRHFLSLGDWDMNTMMPPKGATSRGNAMAQLGQYVHQLITDPEMGALLDEAQSQSGELSFKQKANLREMRRQWETETALNDDFVERKAKLLTESQVKWAECRENNDFKGFLPVLKEVVALVREEAKLLSRDSGKPLYEALLHQYECGMSLESVDAIFSEVKSWLPALLKRVTEHRKDVDKSIVALPLHFPLDVQEKLGRRLMSVWEFDFEAGRMDVSQHPFTGMTKEDTRVTTKYNPSNFTTGLYATIHETGHARYEQNCGPKDMLNQPVCNARSMVVHESQSLFAERIIGRSGSFGKYLTPVLAECFGEQPAFTAGNMKAVLQRVEPGLIRIFADEVTYPLHIILRYEIERALLEGKMEAEDIPRVWNDKMKEYLGLETLGNDKMGCLQDIHWSGGMFGYFPTYSLGAMFAAQLMATIKRELGEDVVARCLNTGDLGPIFAKQKEKIWDNGCLYETNELMVKATGEPLNPKYFREYLERRYLRCED